MIRRACLIALITFVPTMRTDAQNMLTNHSFESPAFDPAYPPIVATGWTSEFPGNMYIDDINNCPVCVTDGTQFHTIGSSLEQNTGVAVIPGATYRLAFDYVSFTDDPSGPAVAELYTNPTTSNAPIGAGAAPQLLTQSLPTGPTHTAFSQSFDITAPLDAEGYLHVRFFSGNNYRGFDNVLLTLIAEPPVNNADFNQDSIVDAADYVVWRKHMGIVGSATQMMGDANGDTNVNEADFNVWRAQFGSMPVGVGASVGALVPEPAATGLLISLGLVLAARQTRRGRAPKSRTRFANGECTKSCIKFGN